MNDQQTLEAMLDRAGLVWTISEDAEDIATMLEVKAQNGPENLGYPYCISHLRFDEEGSLVDWGCWERWLCAQVFTGCLGAHRLKVLSTSRVRRLAPSRGASRG